MVFDWQKKNQQEKIASRKEQLANDKVELEESERIESAKKSKEDEEFRLSLAHEEAENEAEFARAQEIYNEAKQRYEQKLDDIHARRKAGHNEKGEAIDMPGARIFLLKKMIEDAPDEIDRFEKSISKFEAEFSRFVGVALKIHPNAFGGRMPTIDDPVEDKTDNPVEDKRDNQEDGNSQNYSIASSHLSLALSKETANKKRPHGKAKTPLLDDTSSFNNGAMGHTTTLARLPREHQNSQSGNELLQRDQRGPENSTEESTSKSWPATATLAPLPQEKDNWQSGQELLQQTETLSSSSSTVNLTNPCRGENTTGSVNSQAGKTTSMAEATPVAPAAFGIPIAASNHEQQAGVPFPSISVKELLLLLLNGRELDQSKVKELEYFFRNGKRSDIAAYLKFTTKEEINKYGTRPLKILCKIASKDATSGVRANGQFPESGYYMSPPSKGGKAKWVDLIAEFFLSPVFIHPRLGIRTTTEE